MVVFIEEWNSLDTFGREHYEVPFCEIILDLEHWFSSRR